MCGFFLGVCDVFYMDSVLIWDVECIVLVYIYGNFINEYLNDNILIIIRFRLYLGFFWSLCFFLFRRMFVILVFMNNRILIKMVGMIVVKI